MARIKVAPRQRSPLVYVLCTRGVVFCGTAAFAEIDLFQKGDMKYV